jgi:hypothetical protein
LKGVLAYFTTTAGRPVFFGKATKMPPKIVKEMAQTAWVKYGRYNGFLFLLVSYQHLLSKN